MRNSITSIWLLVIMCSSFFTSCSESANESIKVDTNTKQDQQEFIRVLEKHLQAVSNKDVAALKSTMAPDGKMQLILPASEIINSVDSFMNFHKEWFKDTTWSFETKILNTEIGNKIGIGITEIIYREPERNGEPYFNRMIVSYALEKQNGNWYIIKDHASSIEKSTDKK